MCPGLFHARTGREDERPNQLTRLSAGINIVPMSDETGPGQPWGDMTPRDFGREAPPLPETLFPIPDDCGTGDLAELLDP